MILRQLGDFNLNAVVIMKSLGAEHDHKSIFNRQKMCGKSTLIKREIEPYLYAVGVILSSACFTW